MKAKRSRKFVLLELLLAVCLFVQGIYVQAEERIVETSSRVEAPGNVETGSENDRGILIRWEPVSGASAYSVYRSEDGGKSWKNLGSTGEAEYADGNVKPGAEYFYQVQSLVYDGTWHSGGFSEAVKGSFSICVPSGLKAESDGGNAVLSWSYDDRADAFGVMRSEAGEDSYQWLTAVSGKNYKDTSVEEGRTYSYKVYAAVNVNGTWYNSVTSDAAEVYVSDPDAMAAVEDLTVVNQDDRGMTISWKADKNTTAYVVYRVNPETGRYIWLDCVGTTSYVDKDVKLGETYTYCIQNMKYENGAWKSGPVSGEKEKSFLPAAPVGLRVAAGAGNQAVKISWTPSGTASTFGILRAESEDGIYSWRGVSGGNSFTDEGLAQGKTYYYKVYATVNKNDVWYNGSSSQVVSGKVQEAPSSVEVQPESFTSVRVRWSKAPGADGYIVWRSEDGGSRYSVLGSVNQCEFIDGKLDYNRTYSYKIQSVNYVDGKWGYGAYSNPAEGKPGVGVPGGLSAVQDSREYYGIKLSWQPVKDVNVYGVMRSEHGKNQYTWLTATNGTSFVDKTGNSDTRYDYKVYASVQEEGQWHNGESSSPVSATVRSYGGVPVVSNLKATYVSGLGYYLTCDVASSYPVSRVLMASWTTKDGQDDVYWKYADVRGNEASCWVYTTEHHYEIGQYENCAYVYDVKEQSGATWCGVNVPVFSKGSGTGWYDTNGTSGDRYYLLNGRAVTGWRYIGGYKYYFYPNGALCQDVDSRIGVQSNYVIKVNKEANCVTIYASDGANGYIIPVKSMLCSTGDDTPLGTFYTPAKYRWQGMFNGTYAQYATRLTAGQGFLFHSITYEKKDNHTLLTEGYNGLGVSRSAGCIRLLCKNAYWIYVRCPLGTKVIVYNDSNPGPFYRPVLVPIPPTQRYDPTDPFL